MLRRQKRNMIIVFEVEVDYKVNVQIVSDTCTSTSLKIGTQTQVLYLNPLACRGHCPLIIRRLFNQTKRGALSV